MSLSTPPVVAVTPPGQSSQVWAQVLTAAPRVGLVELCTSLLGRPSAGQASPLLVLTGAHPDDETIGAGRLAATWSRHLGPVLAVVATAGEACVDHVMPRPRDLAHRRLAEWRQATRLLGVSERHTFGLPDGGLAGRADELTDVLRATVVAARRGRPIVLAAPWHRDPHPDHAALGDAARDVAEVLGLPLLEYPVWASFWSPPSVATQGPERLVVLPPDAATDAATADALTAYATQLEPILPGYAPVVPAAMLDHHRSQPLFLDRCADLG